MHKITQQIVAASVSLLISILAIHRHFPTSNQDISKQRPEVTARLKRKLLALYKSVMADAPDWHVAKHKKWFFEKIRRRR